MKTMISEVYVAFRKAGVPEEDARHAAETLSAENLASKEYFKHSGSSIKEDIKKLEKEVLVIKWMLSLIITIQVIPILKALIP